MNWLDALPCPIRVTSNPALFCTQRLLSLSRMQLTFIATDAVPHSVGHMGPLKDVGPKPLRFDGANFQEVSTVLHNFTEDDGTAVPFYAASLLRMPLVFELQMYELGFLGFKASSLVSCSVWQGLVPSPGPPVLATILPVRRSFFSHGTSSGTTQLRVNQFVQLGFVPHFSLSSPSDAKLTCKFTPRGDG